MAPELPSNATISVALEFDGIAVGITQASIPKLFVKLLAREPEYPELELKFTASELPGALLLV